MHIVVFCESFVVAKELSEYLILGLCDHVAVRTKHGRMVFEIDEKNIVIDIRQASKEKTAGLRPDYVLMYDTTLEFTEYWEYNMGGRYKELKHLSDLLRLVVDDYYEEESNEQTR